MSLQTGSSVLRHEWHVVNTHGETMPYGWVLFKKALIEQASLLYRKHTDGGVEVQIHKLRTTFPNKLNMIGDLYTLYASTLASEIKALGLDKASWDWLLIKGVVDGAYLDNKIHPDACKTMHDTLTTLTGVPLGVVDSVRVLLCYLELLERGNAHQALSTPAAPIAIPVDHVHIYSYNMGKAVAANNWVYLE